LKHNIVKQNTNIVASAATLTTWIFSKMLVWRNHSFSRFTIRSRTLIEKCSTFLSVESVSIDDRETDKIDLGSLHLGSCGITQGVHNVKTNLNLSSDSVIFEVLERYSTYCR